MSKNEVNTGYEKKFQREMSKAGQEIKKLESEDLNAHFSNNSESEREKTSNRKPTGTNESDTKTYKKRRQILSWRPLK
jgi:hypothetical protein